MLIFDYKGERITTAHLGDMFLAFIVGDVSAEDVSGLFESLERQPAPCNFWCWLWPASRPPETIRKRSHELVRLIDDKTKRSALVIRDSTLAGTTTRLFVAGLELLRRQKSEIKVFDSAIESKDWLAQQEGRSLDALFTIIEEHLKRPDMSHFKPKPKSGSVPRP